jgi:hypothetical protein
MKKFKTKYSSPVDKLLSYVDPRDFKEWPNYLKLGFTEAHVPELIKMATDEQLNFSDSEELYVWAPTHAWRTLGLLKAKEAIEPLITLLYILDNDEWCDEELPYVFGMIGESSLPPLARYLTDSSRSESSRVTAACCLDEVAKVHEQEKEKCVALFCSQLEKFEIKTPELNGILIWFLMRYKAVESFPIIKEAYERDCVDVSIIGDLANVEYEFGMRKDPPQVQLFAEESNNEAEDQLSTNIE